MKKKIIPFMIWLIGTVLGKTWRIKIIEPAGVDSLNPNCTPTVYCFWHASLLTISYIYRKTGKTAIVSRSRDGILAAKVANRWGHDIISGSSARGGMQAVRQAISTLGEGRSVAITPDGPRGPREVAKPGAAQIAITGHAPAVAARLAVKGAWRLKSWDRFIIPWPFAKVTVILSEPITPSEAAGVEEITRKIQDFLIGGGA